VWYYVLCVVENVYFFALLVSFCVYFLLFFWTLSSVDFTLLLGVVVWRNFVTLCSFLFPFLRSFCNKYEHAIIVYLDALLVWLYVCYVYRWYLVLTCVLWFISFLFSFCSWFCRVVSLVAWNLYHVYQILCKLCFPCIYALYKFCAYLITLCVRQLEQTEWMSGTMWILLFLVVGGGMEWGGGGWGSYWFFSYSDLLWSEISGCVCLYMCHLVVICYCWDYIYENVPTYSLVGPFFLYVGCLFSSIGVCTIWQKFVDVSEECASIFIKYVFSVISVTVHRTTSDVTPQDTLVSVVTAESDRLCGLVVRVPGYRTRGSGSVPGATRFSKKEWVWNGVHSASRGTTEEPLGRNSSGSGLGNREYGRRDSSRWPRGALYPQTLAVTSLTIGGRSVGIGHGV
jgi:hypothetical protein